jgi:hypothetical protein
LLGLVVSGVATFGLSLIVARKVLRMRCRGIGPPFRRHARYWAWFIVACTAVVSTAVGLLIVAASAGPAALALIGVIVSAGLWFAKVPPQRDLDMLPRRPSDVLTLPFSRLYDQIGEDLQAWCDYRCEAAKPKPPREAKPEWIAEAAQYYWQIMDRVSDPQARADMNRWRDSIAHKINLVRLIDLDAGQDRLRASLELHSSTAARRKYRDDDQDRLARRLETEALHELHLLLAYAYRHGYHNMLVYPFRPGAHRPQPQPPKAEHVEPIEPITPDR